MRSEQQWIHSNGRDGGPMPVGRRQHTRFGWVLEKANGGGDVKDGDVVMFRGMGHGMYWHSNAPEGRGMSLGPRRADMGWRVIAL